MHEYHEPMPNLYGHSLSHHVASTSRRVRLPRSEHCRSMEPDDRELGTTYVLKTPSGSVYIPSDVTTTDTMPHQKVIYSDTMVHKEERYATPFSTMSTTLPIALTPKYRPAPSQYHTVQLPARKRPTPLTKCTWRGAALALLGVSLMLASLLVYLITVVGIGSNVEQSQPEQTITSLVATENITPRQPDSRLAEGIRFRQTVLPQTTPDTNQLIAEAGDQPVNEAKLDRHYTVKLAAGANWSSELTLPRSWHVQWELGVPRGGVQLSLYGRRELMPSATNFDFSRRRLANFYTDTEHIKFEEYLERGTWIITLANEDFISDVRVGVSMSLAVQGNSGCLSRCNGNGQCLQGVCRCHHLYSGVDCSQRLYPMLCSGRGNYQNGTCQCYSDSYGDMCQYDSCSGSLCSSNAESCVGQGPFCHLTDPLSYNDKHCSGHGKFDLFTETCRCHTGWRGTWCSEEVCDPDCGLNGECHDQKCHCHSLWNGSSCQNKQCDARCYSNGQCVGGECVCEPGWNGVHCTLEGCSGNCSGHGECMLEDRWRCYCDEGWSSSDCSQPLESVCDDRRDNDADGLIDCEDPECCESASCFQSELCRMVPDPFDILLRRHSLPATASFYDQISFLEDNVQLDLKDYTFSARRVSVVRGRVVTKYGVPVPGVHITCANVVEGYTLSRADGWFDLMVTAGGVATLTFVRSPFIATNRSVWLPYNEFVMVDDIVLTTDRSEITQLSPPTHFCEVHDADSVRPYIVTTWKHEFRGPGTSSAGAAVIAETQVVRETVPVGGTPFSLVYQSSGSRGFGSTVRIQLLPETVPRFLTHVFLVVEVGGRRFEKRFEATNRLQYTYSWDSLNVYNQRVYGLASVKLRVGHKYLSCPSTVWSVHTTQISASDLPISDIGGWNLDIHHAYNRHHGILQLGSGTNLYLLDLPPLLQTAVGESHQRPAFCPPPLCEGAAGQQQLLAVSAMVVSPGGTLYFADGNLIRQLAEDGTVKTVAMMNDWAEVQRYYLAYSHRLNTLYVSIPDEYRVLRIGSLNLESLDARDNLEPAVGSGVRCHWDKQMFCGDGQAALTAKLIHPKGVCESIDGELFLVDGKTLRKVDIHGRIHTILGSWQNENRWRHLPCSAAIPAESLQLNNPNAIAVSPVDNHVYFIDNNMVLKLSENNEVSRVAGTPDHCTVSPGPTRSSHTVQAPLATEEALVEPSALAIDMRGRLYIAESDGEQINRVKVMEKEDGRLYRLAGSDTFCNCSVKQCRCFNDEIVQANIAKLSQVSAIAVTPEGIVYISDEGAHRIRRILPNRPSKDTSEQYTIALPQHQDEHTFDKYGRHVLTRKMADQTALYRFQYSESGSSGQLTGVLMSDGQQLHLQRDSRRKAVGIVVNNMRKNVLGVSSENNMENFITDSGFKFRFEYDLDNGLLLRKSDSSGERCVFEYDEFGRLTSHVTSTGHHLQLSTNQINSTIRLVVRIDGAVDEIVEILPHAIYRQMKDGTSMSAISSDQSTEHRASWSETTSTLTAPHYSLGSAFSRGVVILPDFSWQITRLANNVVRYFEWRRSVPHDSAATSFDEQLFLNGRLVFTVSKQLNANSTGSKPIAANNFNSIMQETVRSSENRTILRIDYDQMGRPSLYALPKPLYNVQMEYNNMNLLSGWFCGERSVRYSYDELGRLLGVFLSHQPSLEIGYTDQQTRPSWLQLPSGGRYHIDEDQMGRMSAIISPSGFKHQWLLQSLPTCTVLQYSHSASSNPVTILFVGNFQRVLERRLSEVRRVTSSYDRQWRLLDRHWSTGSTDYTYSHGQLHSIRHREHSLRTQLRLSRRGSLVVGMRVTHTDALRSLTSYRFSYQYDNIGRVSQVRGIIGAHQLPSVNITYSPTLQNWEQYDGIRVIQSGPGQLLLESTSFSRQLLTDSYGQLHQLKLQLGGNSVSRLQLVYNTAGRLISSQHRLTRTEVETTHNYTYAKDGQLETAEVRQAIEGGSRGAASGHSWRFVYDPAGNLVQLSDNGVSTNCQFANNLERVVECDQQGRIDYDSSGFVTNSGAQRFDYDSWGRLSGAVRVTARDEVHVQFGYDHAGRLITRRRYSVEIGSHVETAANRAETVWQLIYADLHRPNRLTHVHYEDKALTVEYFYDVRGLLMYVRRQREELYVATDAFGTPLAVFSRDGSLVTQYNRDPWGHHLTAPSDYLLLDMNGWLVDHEMDVLFDHRFRPYLPRLRQYLTPDLEIATLSGFELGLPDPYRINNNDPVNLVRSSFLPMEVTATVPKPPGKDYWLAAFDLNLAELSGEPSSIFDQSSPLPHKEPVRFSLESLQQEKQRNFFNQLHHHTTTNQLLPPPGSWQPPLLPSSLLLCIGDVHRPQLLGSLDGQHHPDLVQYQVLRHLLNNSVVLTSQYESHHFSIYLLRKADRRAADVRQFQRLNATSRHTIDRLQIGVVRLWRLRVGLVYKSSINVASIRAAKQRLISWTSGKHNHRSRQRRKLTQKPAAIDGWV